MENLKGTGFDPNIDKEKGSGTQLEVSKKANWQNEITGIPTIERSKA